MKNEELKELMDTYDKKHKDYEEKAAKMLMEDGSKEKEPGMMASAFSKNDHRNETDDEGRQQQWQSCHGRLQHGDSDSGRTDEYTESGRQRRSVPGPEDHKG